MASSISAARPKGVHHDDRMPSFSVTTYQATKLMLIFVDFASPRGARQRIALARNCSR